MTSCMVVEISEPIITKTHLLPIKIDSSFAQRSTPPPTKIDSSQKDDSISSSSGHVDSSPPPVVTSFPPLSTSLPPLSTFFRHCRLYYAIVDFSSANVDFSSAIVDFSSAIVDSLLCPCYHILRDHECRSDSEAIAVSYSSSSLRHSWYPVHERPSPFALTAYFLDPGSGQAASRHIRAPHSGILGLASLTRPEGNFLTWAGPQPHMVITEPELAKEILSNKDGTFPKIKINGHVKKLLGDGLGIAEGPKWLKLRKLANHAFYAESLKEMIPAMIASVETMLENWKQYEGKEIEVSKEFMILSSEVISRTAFGSSYLEGKNIFEMLTMLGILIFKNADKIRPFGIEKIWKTRDDIESDKIEQSLRDSVLAIVRKREEKASMIINEALRLYTPAISLVRRVTKNVKLGKYEFPANMELHIPPLALHRNQDIWGKDAHLFKPERFSEGVAMATKNNPMAFLPFGFGPRTCVGLNFANNEVKIAMSIILQRYKFTLSPNYVHSPLSLITVRPQNGVQIMLQTL
ncbi:hypothetical protein DH2020_012020 [Rehmannia glutinosa]|uniref:Cytochrome P450 protein n=1 Tax=Rehmannia glutinosa TaxID=99300 RepID=A0ABR0XF46_REHGL